jgi:hypothetical protein
VDAALGAGCDYRARFSLECGDLALDLAGGPGGGLAAALKLWRLEAVEHIPASPAELAASSACLEEVRHALCASCSLQVASP